MLRDFKSDVIILQTDEYREKHLFVKILTKGCGVLQTIVYGAKSKKNSMSGSLEQANYGEAELYFDPIREKWQLKAFTLQKANHSIRNNYEKLYISSLWSEIVLKSNQYDLPNIELYNLLHTSLELLDSCKNKNEQNSILLQFIIRYLKSEGLWSKFENCPECGKTLCRDDKLYYQKTFFWCTTCRPSDKLLELSSGSRLYINRILEGEIKDFCKVKLSNNAIIPLLELLFRYIQDIIGRPLITLKGIHDWL